MEYIRNVNVVVVATYIEYVSPLGTRCRVRHLVSKITFAETCSSSVSDMFHIFVFNLDKFRWSNNSWNLFDGIFFARLALWPRVHWWPIWNIFLTCIVPYIPLLKLRNITDLFSIVEIVLECFIKWISIKVWDTAVYLFFINPHVFWDLASFDLFWWLLRTYTFIGFHLGRYLVVE